MIRSDVPGLAAGSNLSINPSSGDIDREVRLHDDNVRMIYNMANKITELSLGFGDTTTPE